MKKFYDDFGFIIGFMFLTLIFSTAFGEKATQYFLLLTLVSMILFNSQKFITFFNSLKE